MGLLNESEKTYYGNSTGIFGEYQFVSLSDIISQFNDMNLVIGENAVGLPIWKVMAFRIWEVYHEEFCDAYYS